MGAIKELKDKLNLKNLPRRMECYDISNISGTNQVCSMVVFKNGETCKKDYRKFKIKKVKGANDFASLQEALKRRLERLKEGRGESFKEKPDLIVIDGGKGQLSAVNEILSEYDFGIDLISLAKKQEEVFVTESLQPIILKKGSVELRLLQRLRDEAHRFAITFHRQVRQKQQTHSELDDIPGVGPKKRDLLLNIFGTSEKIKGSSVEELESVKGINKALAQIIYNFFNKNE